MPMNVLMGKYQAHAIQGTKTRLSNASRHASEELKNQRKKRKIAKAGLADTIHAKEGVLYIPGGFND